MKGRQVVEQYFARLGDREVEQTTHYALNSVRNQMTLAHIAHSLVAVAAALLLDAPEKYAASAPSPRPPTCDRPVNPSGLG